MNVIKSINMGFPQRTFDFEQSPQDLKKVLTFIDSRIADNDQVMLDQVVNHFSIQPDRWSETHIIKLVFDLFKDDKIHFIINGKKILPENIKIHPSEPAQRKLKLLQTSEIISIVKPANDLIVEKQIASAKARAIEKIEKKIDKIVKVLDEKKANSDIRNKALFPLQISKKKINMASSLQSIADYLDDAIDKFDHAMDMLG